ncbi:MAG: hypothetical protein P4M08_14440 [Oligoflexia bacterium]|nr:hypothetical protein [Oligoflexia bacterium]
MKKHLLMSVVVLSFVSPALADNGYNPMSPPVGENSSSHTDHRGTQCKYAKSIAEAKAAIASAESSTDSSLNPVRGYSAQ